MISIFNNNLILQTDDLAILSKYVFPNKLLSANIWSNKYTDRIPIELPNSNKIILNLSGIINIKNIYFNCKTKSIQLCNNRIKTINNNNFPKNLEHLELYDNTIKKINYKLLPISLKTLDIHQNNIKNIILIHPNLEQIKLDGCIMNINCPKLKVVHIYKVRNLNPNEFFIRGSKYLEIFLWNDKKNKFKLFNKHN